MEHTWRKTCALLFVWTAMLFPAACGYHFSGGGALPGDIKTLNISMLANKTGETGIEALVTNDLVNQFTRFDTVRLVDKKQAEAILSGTIRSTRIRTIAHSTPDESMERRITLYLDVELKDREGRRIWAARGLSADDSYEVASTKRGTELNKKSAIAEISERVAERIYYRLTDEF
ncbi:MAG: LPS assembly lipoprotein LptE [Desulfosalsimonadaceae bacterium]